MTYFIPIEEKSSSPTGIVLTFKALYCVTGEVVNRKRRKIKQLKEMEIPKAK